MFFHSYGNRKITVSYTHLDVYKRQLYENSNFEKVIEDLKERNLIYSEDGALWFRTSMFADDEDLSLIHI